MSIIQNNSIKFTIISILAIISIFITSSNGQTNFPWTPCPAGMALSGVMRYDINNLVQGQPIGYINGAACYFTVNSPTEGTYRMLYFAPGSYISGGPGLNVWIAGFIKGGLINGRRFSVMQYLQQNSDGSYNFYQRCGTGDQYCPLV